MIPTTNQSETDWRREFMRKKWQDGSPLKNRNPSTNHKKYAHTKMKQNPFEIQK
jgi:hypothetical protein